MNMPCPHRRLLFSPLAVSAIALLALVAAGCSSGYAGRIREFRYGLDANDPVYALEAIDQVILESPTDDVDRALLLIERAAAYQAIGDHAAAVQDFADADQMLEILNLTPKGAEGIAEYLWSDDAGLYRPPIYEKLMVNVMALASYLAMNDLRGAMVEARRIEVLTRYFDNTTLWDHPMISAAHVMARLAMELGGDDASAARFYLTAWEIGGGPDLAAALVRTSQTTFLRDRPEVVEAREVLGLAPDAVMPPAPDHEIISITFSGLAPRREAVRFPIGLVLGWVPRTYHYSSGHRTVVSRIEAEDLVTWINFPELVLRPPLFQSFDLRVDGRRHDEALLVDVAGFALDQWDADRGGIAAAAIVRAITRILAREAIEAIGNESDEAALIGLIVQAGMQAADTPDTRSWNAMPAGVWLTRVAAEPGVHAVEVIGRGGGVDEIQSVEVEVDEEWPVAVVVTRFFD